MKTTLGKKIIVMFFVPFLIIFGALSLLTFSTISQYVNNWIQLEIKGITEINATDLAGRVNSVRISVLSAADILENIGYDIDYDRMWVDNIVKSMFENDSVYNAWIVYEPEAFDGNDGEHQSDYPGAPSGRFMRSYVMEDGEILVAPDMDEETVDDPDESPWYTEPRDSGRLYIDMDHDGTNIWDYDVGEEPIYTLSVVMPIFREGQVIGCVGADVMFDDMKLSVGGDYDSTVAVFYSSGRIFYSPDMEYAEESIDTLGFLNTAQIWEAFDKAEPLFLSDEYCIFTDTRSFTVFQPIRIDHYNGYMFMFVATPRSILFESLLPIFLIIAATTVVVIGILLILLLYVVRKVSKPINQLTLAANAISQGDIETEIGYFSDNESGEIGLLSQSLHRMVEQFRVHAIKMEQAQSETGIKLRIEAFIASSGNMQEILEGLATMLCDYFRVFKTTIVYINAGKASAFSYIKQTGLPDKEKLQFCDFLYHDEVEALLGSRKLAFLNAHAISAQNITFLEPQTNSACFTPLKKKTLIGYLIFENNDETRFSEGTESIMMYISKILSEWLSEKEWEQSDLQTEFDVPHEEAAIVYPDILWNEQDSAPEEQISVVSKLKCIDGLNVDFALESMGGLDDVYEQSVKLTARLLPETISKMDHYISEGDLKKFAIEVHGIKSVLRNIGAANLGDMAAQLEKAAQDDKIDDCGENYPLFKELLTGFTEQLDMAITTEAVSKEKIDKKTLSTALETAKSAAESFDAMQALETVNPLSKFSFNEETDELLEKVIFALEEFNCEGAIINIKKMEEILNGT